MSKYQLLWKHIAESSENSLTLSFAQIEEIAGIPIDHSFLKYKKEIKDFGWEVGKISMKNQTVTFQKIK